MYAVGDRVTFKTSWDIFACDTLISAGATGVVSEFEGGDQLLGVKMDTIYPHLAEWENVVWLDSEIQPFADVIQPIGY